MGRKAKMTLTDALKKVIERECHCGSPLHKQIAKAIAESLTLDKKKIASILKNKRVIITAGYIELDNCESIAKAIAESKEIIKVSKK